MRMLIDNFGKSYGAWMHDAAWGRDDRPVVTESEPVSMSRETTFDRDLHAVRDRPELGSVFTELCMKLAGDRHGMPVAPQHFSRRRARARSPLARVARPAGVPNLVIRDHSIVCQELA